jgi:hypothetical protein
MTSLDRAFRSLPCLACVPGEVNRVIAAVINLDPEMVF